MSLPNIANDKFFMRLVKQKVLKVTKSGKVFNLKTGRRLGRKPNRAGYCSIGYKDAEGVVHHILIHRLVVLVFIRPLTKKEIVNHINGIKIENKISNLEITTYAGNNQHAHDTGLANTKHIGEKLSLKLMGHRHASSLLTPTEVKTIRRLYKNRVSQRTLAQRFNVSRPTIQRIVNNTSYKF